MASPRPESQALENIADILTCSVCLETFNENERLPKLLPCHHTFCELCLKRMIQKNSSVICPTCRKQVIFHTRKELTNLQTNFYITQMKDLLGEQAVLKTKGCKKHRDQELTHFCKSCEIPICSDCSISEHKETLGHDTQPLGMALKEQRHLLEMEMSSAQEIIMSSKQVKKRLEVELLTMFASKDRALADVDATFDRYVEAINLRRQQLLENVRTMHEEKRQMLSGKLEQTCKEESSLLGLIEQCEESLQRGGITDILAYKAKTASRNSEMRQKQLSQPDSDDKISKNFIKFEAGEGQVEFLKCVQGLGEAFANRPLPCLVQFDKQHTVAGLFTTQSFTLHGMHNEDIVNYPIDVDIQDRYDDMLPCLVRHRRSNIYEVTFRPQVSGTHRVRVKFLETGTLSVFPLEVHSNNPMNKIGERGCDSGRFEFPRAVTVNAKNEIFVMDTGNSLIQKFDKYGKFLLKFPISDDEENKSSCGITYDSIKNLLICPEVSLSDAELADGSAMLFYTQDGSLRQRLSYQSVLRKALSGAVNSRGQLIIVDFELNTVFIFDRNNRLLRKFGEKGVGPGQFNHPTFVCVGQNDNIIVSDGDNNRVQIFDSVGKYLLQFGSKGTGKGEFNMPFGVAADSQGNILVVDGGNRRVQIFKHTGDFVGCIESDGDRFNAPRGIAVTSDGYVLVADRDNHCVKKFKYLLCTSL